MCPPKAYAPLSLLLRTTAAAGCARAGPHSLPRPYPHPLPYPCLGRVVRLPSFGFPSRIGRVHRRRAGRGCPGSVSRRRGCRRASLVEVAVRCRPASPLPRRFRSRQPSTCRWAICRPRAASCCSGSGSTPSPPARGCASRSRPSARARERRGTRRSRRTRAASQNTRCGCAAFRPQFTPPPSTASQRHRRAQGPSSKCSPSFGYLAAKIISDVASRTRPCCSSRPPRWP